MYYSYFISKADDLFSIYKFVPRILVESDMTSMTIVLRWTWNSQDDFSTKVPKVPQEDFIFEMEEHQLSFPHL